MLLVECVIEHLLHIDNTHHAYMHGQGHQQPSSPGGPRCYTEPVCIGQQNGTYENMLITQHNLLGGFKQHGGCRTGVACATLPYHMQMHCVSVSLFSMSASLCRISIAKHWLIAECVHMCVSVYITMLIPILGAELQSILLLIEALHVVAISEQRQQRCTSCALSRR